MFPGNVGLTWECGRHLVLDEVELGRYDGVFGGLQMARGALVGDDKQSYVAHDVQLL